MKHNWDLQELKFKKRLAFLLKYFKHFHKNARESYSSPGHFFYLYTFIHLMGHFCHFFVFGSQWLRNTFCLYYHLHGFFIARMTKHFVRMQNVVPKLSRTPGKIRWPGPTRMGQHNEEIYCGKLGLPQARLAELKEKGVI